MSSPFRVGAVGAAGGDGSGPPPARYTPMCGDRADLAPDQQLQKAQLPTNAGNIHSRPAGASEPRQPGSRSLPRGPRPSCAVELRWGCGWRGPARGRPRLYSEEGRSRGPVSLSCARQNESRPCALMFSVFPFNEQQANFFPLFLTYGGGKKSPTKEYPGTARELAPKPCQVSDTLRVCSKSEPVRNQSTSDSGQDLRVVSRSPTSHSLLSTRSAWDSLSPSLCPSPCPTHARSLKIH